MPLTDVAICNMALGHIGHTKFVANLETERSLEAEVLNLYYQPARDFVLEDYPWPEATKYATLGLVADYTNVTTPHDWNYSYRYPADCLFARRLVTLVGRVDPNPPPFRTGVDDVGRLIYTDQQDAVLEYTQLLTDPARFRTMLGQAISWYVAGLIAPSLARDRKQAEGCLKMYGIIKSMAAAQAGNEQQQSVEPESEFIRSRE